IVLALHNVRRIASRDTAAGGLIKGQDCRRLRGVGNGGIGLRVHKDGTCERPNEPCAEGRAMSRAGKGERIHNRHSPKESAAIQPFNPQVSVSKPARNLRADSIRRRILASAFDLPTSARFFSAAISLVYSSQRFR